MCVSDSGSLTTDTHGYYGSTTSASDAPDRWCRIHSNDNDHDDDDQVLFSRRPAPEHPYQRPSAGPLPPPPPLAASSSSSSSAKTPAAARYLQLSAAGQHGQQQNAAAARYLQLSAAGQHGQQQNAALHRWNSSGAGSRI